MWCSHASAVEGGYTALQFPGCSSLMSLGVADSIAQQLLIGHSGQTSSILPHCISSTWSTFRTPPCIVDRVFVSIDSKSTRHLPWRGFPSPVPGPWHLFWSRKWAIDPILSSLLRCMWHGWAAANWLCDAALLFCCWYLTCYVTVEHCRNGQ